MKLSTDKDVQPTYAAFLRGINVGGNKRIRMDELHSAFQSWSFEKVATVLASGNVLFDAHSEDPQLVKQLISTGLKANYGFDVKVFIRTIGDLQAMAARNPFKDYSETSELKLYVTFLDQKAAPKIIIPYQSSGKELEIIHMTDFEIFSAVNLSAHYGTTDMMTFLEKKFGSGLTTRNWNTVLKILELYQKLHLN